MLDYIFLVKGAYFRGREARELSDSLPQGAKVTVKRDEDNEHDEYACSVYYEDIQIGYVEKDFAMTVAELFDVEDYIYVEGHIIGRVSGARNTSYPEVQLTSFKDKTASAGHGH